MDYIIEASEILSDESSMTGETEPIKKNIFLNALKEEMKSLEKAIKKNPIYIPFLHLIILSGSRILQGEGKFIVIVVGPKS